MKKHKTQKDCDKLLTPLIAKKYPKCLLCPNPTQVAHHYIRKACSSSLRYDEKNLINLCHKCHFKVHHNNESFWNNEIRDIKGEDWWNYLKENQSKYVKRDCLYYDITFERLSSSLSTP